MEIILLYKNVNILIQGEFLAMAIKISINNILLQENLTVADINTLEKWQSAELKLYNDQYLNFQKRLDSYGRVKMDKEVSLLRNIREKLKEDCKVEEFQAENHVKTEREKYSYSSPFNRNTIRYISG